MNPNLPLESEAMLNDICDALHELRLPFVLHDLQERRKDPSFSLLDFLTVWHEITCAEVTRRRTNWFNNELKRASLKYPAAALDDSIYDPERNLDTETIQKLSTLEWIDEPQNLVITGKTGAGKTYMSCALAVCALHRHRTVRFRKASTLLHELTSAETAGTLNAAISKWERYDLLVIDDFGLNRLEPNECRNLFEVIDARDCRKATVIVSQLPPKGWYDKFANVTLAEAILDRVLHKAYRLNMNGASMRCRS